MKLAQVLGQQKQVSIRKLIHKALAGYEEARSHKTVHASDVVDKDFCPRQFALFDITKKKPKGQFVSTAQRVTYEYGHFIQARLNEKWLRHCMYGDWKCSYCNHLLEARKAPDFPCPTCGARLWRYKEMRITSAEYAISGGVDAIVDVGEPKLRLIEVKSMDKDQFQKLAAPLADHRARTALYLRLLAESTHPLAPAINDQVGHVLYVSKSFGFKDVEMDDWDDVKDSSLSPFKEFLVWRDDASLQDRLDRALSLKAFRAGGALPARVCLNTFDKRAKSCPVIGECFGGSYT